MDPSWVINGFPWGYFTFHKSITGDFGKNRETEQFGSFFSNQTEMRDEKLVSANFLNGT